MYFKGLIKLIYCHFFFEVLIHIIRVLVVFLLTILRSNQPRYSWGVTLQFRNEEESRNFHCAFEQWKEEVVVQGAVLISLCGILRKIIFISS